MQNCFCIELLSKEDFMWCSVDGRHDVQGYRNSRATALQLLERCKATLLEHNIGQFAATALGQVLGALNGTKVVTAPHRGSRFLRCAVGAEGHIATRLMH